MTPTLIYDLYVSQQVEKILSNVDVHSHVLRQAVSLTPSKRGKTK